MIVEIADTGVGIPVDQREKVFEPFYTSKGTRGGTGLGLSVSHGIIKEHDGWIEVDDGAGRHRDLPSGSASRPPRNRGRVPW